MNRLCLLGLATVLVTAPVSRANDVVWTASGTVGSVSGAGFTGLVSVDDPVAIELRYNDEAMREPTVISEFPGGWTHLEYRVDLNLDLTVTIGGAIWRGTLGTGEEGRPYTVEVQDFQVGPGTFDLFKVSIAAADGADFPSFPGAGTGAGRLLDLRFSSAESEGSAGPDYLGSTMLKCVAQSVSRIAAATGSITDGETEALTYTIDPGTIATELLGVEALELRGVAYDAEFDEVTLTWAAEPQTFYTVQYLDDFLCWRDLISVFADEAEESATFFPAGSGVPGAQLYRVVK